MSCISVFCAGALCSVEGIWGRKRASEGPQPSSPPLQPLEGPYSLCGASHVNWSHALSIWYNIILLLWVITIRATMSCFLPVQHSLVHSRKELASQWRSGRKTLTLLCGQWSHVPLSLSILLILSARAQGESLTVVSLALRFWTRLAVQMMRWSHLSLCWQWWIKALERQEWAGTSDLNWHRRGIGGFTHHVDETRH